MGPHGLLDGEGGHAPEQLVPDGIADPGDGFDVAGQGGRIPAQIAWLDSGLQGRDGMGPLHIEKVRQPQLANQVLESVLESFQTVSGSHQAFHSFGDRIHVFSPGSSMSETGLFSPATLLFGNRLEGRAGTSIANPGNRLLRTDRFMFRHW
jgi:hypothetical protein